MLHTQSFGDSLKKKGFDFYSGVPCSFLKNLINYSINDCRYVMAANEGDAVAVCAGAYLGGHKSVVLMQNSGLTNASSPLTSLNYTFRIPVLGFVSLRGEPGVADEPQHELMGTVTGKFLDVMQIPWQYLPVDNAEAEKQLQQAGEIVASGQSFFFVVKKDTFDAVELRQKSLPSVQNVRLESAPGIDRKPTRLSVLERLNDLKDANTVMLATTGTTGRELYEIKDAPNYLYMVGSMGCVGSLALGLAMARPDKKVIAIDGDGALLMRMGSLATNACYAPANMLHILLDNNCHDSTGGQATASHNVDFARVAAACGYADAFYVHNIDELEQQVKEWLQKPQLTFIHLRTAKGSKKDLGRPGIKPYEVKERLMKHMGNTPRKMR
jgi:phosphonopyruvate decarboxylase